MFEWIANNAVTIIAIAVILVVVAVALICVIKDLKNKSSGGCTGNCSCCGMKCSYDKKKKKN